MINEAVRAALEDAQLTMKDIDAVLCSNMDFFEGYYLSDNVMADYTGAFLKPGFKVNTGGTVGGAASVAAWHHIASGLSDTVMTVAYQKQDEPIHTQSALMTISEPTTERMTRGGGNVFAYVAEKYMHETGATEEHAAIARVKSDQNALRTPQAHLRLNITVEDVLNSRMLAYPLRLLHMCPQSSGACALIVASEEKSKRMAQKPVWYKDHATVFQECWQMTSEPLPPYVVDSTKTVAAQKLFKANGITNPRRDIQCFEMYEPATWCELVWLEHFLICDHAESWKLLEKGVWHLEGEFPVNPSGGVVATNPIGATAMVRVAEAALQVRGGAGEHQVTREVRRAIASAYGGYNWCILHLLCRSVDD
jgi:acetyl-CoA C-acetyltransferase